ncbi:MAG: chromosome segregation protein SMC [Planctomycetota bacterium]|nr:MAG: chromosome segregation protein SMC [Planctomycetota bacterium]
MKSTLLNGVHLKGFLSFGPKSERIELTRLNVLIGPNGVGKSNFIEAMELLHATPADFSGAIRIGGTPADWIWRGGKGAATARLEALISPVNSTPELRYAIEFAESGARLEIVDEVLEEAEKADPHANDVRFYYRFQHGRPAINVSETVTDAVSQRKFKQRKLKRENIDPQQSIFSQMKDPDLYPEITTTAKRFGAMQVFREWSFGRSAALRAAQPANLPTDVLLPQLVNLGLVLNDLEHRAEWSRFNELMRKFLPRYQRLSTKVSAGSVQVYLHEDGMKAPVAATRLSDGTLRFLALLAILLNPESAPLICVEEPELGLHPDAMSLLAELLTEASEKTQLVVTTHSDVLISALTEQTESVLVCDYLENGTELRRLEAAKLKHWITKYRLGEVWRLGKLGGNL